MVKIDEHKKKIKEVKDKINKTTNMRTKRQLIKHLHRLQKELLICNIYLKEKLYDKEK